MQLRTKYLPLLLTVITFLALSFVLYGFLHVLNILPFSQKIQFLFRPVDILVGMTIYFKTSIDFALFMGNLMAANPGWKKRIAIEMGTALGNCLGTLLVLCIWFFFKEAPILMIIMIVLAALVLFEMAEEGLEKFQMPSVRQTQDKNFKYPISNQYFNMLISALGKSLTMINTPFKPLLHKILPEAGITATRLPFSKLFFFSLTIPFILGLDDFAGYIPLFTIINVFNFILGVFLAHMILNLGLFAHPKLTIKVTKHPVVVIIGSIAFVGIGVWGLIEAGEIALRLVNF